VANALFCSDCVDWKLKQYNSLGSSALNLLRSFFGIALSLASIIRRLVQSCFGVIGAELVEAMRLEWVESTKECCDRLEAEDLHLWLVCLDQPQAVCDDLAQYLSVSERERGRRFVSRELQCRFSVGRGALRDILARYAGLTPRALEFQYGSQGKPSLKNELLAFNLTHSGGWAVVAIMSAGEVGVDIELLDREVDVCSLVKRYFHPREVATIMTIDGLDLRQRAFFQHWTCKEAYLKMLGVGLTRRINEVEIKWNIDKDQVVGIDDGCFNGALASWVCDDFSHPFCLAYACEWATVKVKAISWSPRLSR